LRTCSLVPSRDSIPDHCRSLADCNCQIDVQFMSITDSLFRDLNHCTIQREITHSFCCNQSGDRIQSGCCKESAFASIVVTAAAVSSSSSSS
jgi:hypothetical protein